MPVRLLTSRFDRSTGLVLHTLRQCRPGSVNGPLEGYASGFVAELAGQGNTPSSATPPLSLVAQLSDWLAAEDSCHQDHGPGVTPLHGTKCVSAAHIRWGRSTRGASACVGLSSKSEVMQH